MIIIANWLFGPAESRRWVLGAAVTAVCLPLSAFANGRVRVLAGDLPPFSIEGDMERPGFAVEIVGEACRRLGVPFAPRFEPWTRAQRDTVSEPDDLLIGLTRTPEREGQFLWVAELVRLEYAFVSLADRRRIHELAEAADLDGVIVRSGSLFEQMLKTKGLRNLVAVQSEESAARLLQSGRFGAWFTYTLRARALWKDLAFAPRDLAIGGTIDSASLYLAANRLFPPDTARRLAGAMDEIKRDGTEARIHDRYFGAIEP